ncbi:MAG TPA: transposase [Thermaerobacter sp.]
MQALTLRLPLHRPTRAKRRLYEEMARRTTALANNLLVAGRPKGLTSATARPYLEAPLPSAVVNQVLRDVAAARKAKRFRRLWPSFNNQALRLVKAGDFWTASFPTHAGRVRVPLCVPGRYAGILELLGRTAKQGVAKLYCRRGRWYLALSVQVPVAPPRGGRVAGVDLGLRYLAVVSCEGETLFFHGNQAAYIRRRFAALRRRLGMAKAFRALRKLRDKEARWMKDLDHKISRAIVNWCLARGVGTLRMERLEGIRRRRRRDRRDRGRSLHAWSFHRLQRFIAYKARLAGIRVEWVEPARTSRTCPRCGHCDKKNRNGIAFGCRACGYQGHADAVAAQNISRAISGLAGAA